MEGATVYKGKAVMKSDMLFYELMDALRCALHDETPAAEIDFERLVETARKQAVDGMLYKVPQIVMPNDANLRLRRIGNLMMLEKANRWMDVQVATLARKLDESNVEYAVMKGQTCAAFYPHPLHRRSGDIDVYVVPRDFERANWLLEEWGFRLVDKTMLHSTYQKGRLDVEMHFAIQKLQYIPYYNRLRRMTAEEFGEHSFLSIDGYPVRVLPDVLNIILLTTHSFNHVITAGLGLRQVIDWQVVLAEKARALDWGLLLRYLDELHMRKWFLVLAYVNVKYLGMDGTVFAKHGLDYETRSVRRMAVRLLAWMEICGNFGKSMDLGTGKMYFVRYYGLFLLNLIRFFPLNPMEMLAWPWMKLYRGLAHKNHL